MESVTGLGVVDVSAMSTKARSELLVVSSTLSGRIKKDFKSEITLKHMILLLPLESIYIPKSEESTVRVFKSIVKK